MAITHLRPPLPVKIGSYSETIRIHRDERGIAWIDDSNVKVVEVVLDYVLGNSPEQIHEEHPHMPLAQIYAALAHYYDNQQEIDALMQQWQTRYKRGYESSENTAWLEQIHRRSAATSKESA